MKTSTKTKPSRTSGTPASSLEKLNQRLSSKERAALKQLERRLPTALN